MPPNPRYCIPDSRQSDKELTVLVKKIFNRFSGIVFSHGSVIDHNTALLEVDCSTTCGMSGSPIISNGKCIGVYVGGPALPGQKELIDIIRSIGANKFYKAFQIMKSIIRYEQFYEEKIFNELISSPYAKIVKLFAKIESNAPLRKKEKKMLRAIKLDPDIKERKLNNFIQTCFFILYQVVWTYKEKSNYRANIGISIKNEFFNRIEFIISKLLLYRTQSFNSLDEFLGYFIFIA